MVAKLLPVPRAGRLRIRVFDAQSMARALDYSRGIRCGQDRLAAWKECTQANELTHVKFLLFNWAGRLFVRLLHVLKMRDRRHACFAYEICYASLKDGLQRQVARRL